MNEKRNLTKWLYWFTFALAVIFVYKMLDNFTDILNFISRLISILMPFVIGIIVSYLLYIPCRKIEGTIKKSKIKILKEKARGLSVLIVYILAGILVFLAIRFIVPVIKDSVIDLTNNFQGYYNTAIEKLRELPEDSILKNETVINLANEIKSIDIKQYINIDNILNYAKEAIGIATGIFDIFLAFLFV